MVDIEYFKRKQQLIELRYNPYHDPSNGRFTSGGGGGGGFLYSPNRKKGEKGMNGDGSAFYVAPGDGDSGGELGRMLRKADSPNRILNYVPDEKMGKTFQSLSGSDKSLIRRMLRITQKDAEFLQEYYDEKGTQSQSFRVGGPKGTKYTVEIHSTKAGDVHYSLKKGVKKIVDKGSYENVANQMALILARA